MGGHLLVDFTSFVVVGRWVRRWKPLPNLFSQLITCSSRLSLLICDATKRRTSYVIQGIRYLFLHCNLHRWSATYSYTVPSLSLSYQEPLGCCSLMLFHLEGQTFSTLWTWRCQARFPYHQSPTSCPWIDLWWPPRSAPQSSVILLQWVGLIFAAPVQRRSLPEKAVLQISLRRATKLSEMYQ